MDRGGVQTPVTPVVVPVAADTNRHRYSTLLQLEPDYDPAGLCPAGQQRVSPFQTMIISNDILRNHLSVGAVQYAAGMILHDRRARMNRMNPV